MRALWTLSSHVKKHGPEGTFWHVYGAAILRAVRVGGKPNTLTLHMNLTGVHMYSNLVVYVGTWVRRYSGMGTSDSEVTSVHLYQHLHD